MGRYIDYEKSAELLEFISDNSYGNTAKILTEDASGELDTSNIVLSRILALTIGKYKQVDFGEVERSRGDVYKCKFTRNLDESIKTLVDISSATGKISDIAIVSKAFENLKSMKNVFENGFRTQNNIAMLVYNLVFSAVLEATSYYIAAAVNVAKTGNDKVKLTIYDVNYNDCLLVASLDKFNNAVQSGEIYKFIDNVNESIRECIEDEYAEESLTEDSGFRDLAAALINNEKVKKFITDFKGSKKFKIARNIVGATAVGIAAIYVASKILPTLREIIYWIYRARHKLAETAALQAEFLTLNIEALSSKENLDEETLSIIEKQKDKVNSFTKLAEKFSLDNDKTNRDAKLDIKNDKIDISDIVI